MTRNYQLITQDKYFRKFWSKPANYLFAGEDNLIALAADEVSVAGMAMPLAFVAVQSTFVLVGIQGLQPKVNTFVAADGAWTGAYIPAIYRAYPFAQMKTTSGETVLCVDEASGLVGSYGLARFYTPDGGIADELKSCIELLNGIARGNEKAAASIQLLHAMNLLEPWPLLSPQDEGSVPALFRISEVALNQLDAERLRQLRDDGALRLAYTQLNSMHLLPRILAASSALPRREPTQANAIAGNGGLISFEGLL